MAAPYNPPKKNEDFILYVSLEDAANPGFAKVNPTLAAGDVKYSGDGGALGNLTTLPVVTPASSAAVKMTVSQSEMNVDNVWIRFSDQTVPPEWSDLIISIPTTQ